MISVISNSTIFLLVASFVMKKKKKSYDAGYKLKVIAYAEEHGNRAAEQQFSPPPTKKTICDWRDSKEQLKKKKLLFSGIDISGSIGNKGSSVLCSSWVSDHLYPSELLEYCIYIYCNTE